MKSSSHFSRGVAAFFASLAVAPAALAAGNISPQVWGPAPNEIIDRVVNIAPHTKSIGVNRNEIVRFVDASSGQVVVVRADTPGGAFDLNQVVGREFANGHPILVYVQDALGEAAG